MSEPRTWRAGDVIDRYRVVGSVGQGGMADVLHVRHVDLGTDHALKVLRVAVPGLHERLLQEGRIQATLRHPNVVAVTDVVRVDGAPGLVMELVRGPTLDQLLRSYQPSPPQADALARGLLAGMAAAHERGLIHRDLKPGNVLIAIEGDGLIAKITDFGLAKALAGDAEPRNRTHSGATLGTPAFMAPEQFRNARQADHRADVFALGAILYELVSGAPAFDGDDLIAIYERTSKAGYRPVRQVAPQIPERMERAIVAALQPVADDRPQSVDDLLLLWTDSTPAPTDAWEPAHLRLVTSMLPDPNRDGGTEGGAFTATEPTPAHLRAPPVTPTASLDEPAPRRRVWLAIPVLLLGLLVMAASTAGVVGLALVLTPPSTPAPAPAPAPTPAPAPAPAPTPAPEPTPVPVPDPPPRPAPTLVPTPTPTPIAPPTPTPVPTPEDDPTPLGANAMVRVEGVTRGFLVDRDAGTRFALGRVPAGVYNLYVSRDDQEPVRVMLLRLESGESRTVRCAGAFCQ